MSERAAYKIERRVIAGVVYAMAWLRIGSVWHLIGMDAE